MKLLLTTATVILLHAFAETMAQNTFPATGNVGVGTATPANKLTVKGDGASISQESADGTTKVGFYTSAGFAYIQTHSNHPLHFTTNNMGPKMTLLVNGNFGIGTTAPEAPLHVATKARVGSVEISSPGIATGNNTAVGWKSLSTITVADINATNNVAVGARAMELNKGSSNAAVGYLCLSDNTTGSYNTGVGSIALDVNNTGEGNTALGYASTAGNTTGGYNTGIGMYALINNVSGSNNTAIGYLANPNAGGYSNTTALGYYATATASNQVRIGNSSVTSIGGYAAWTNVSDARIKTNIKANVPGLALINKLTPVTYNLNLDAADKIIGIDRKDITDETSRKAKEQILQTGFLAQDVEKAAKSLGFDFSGVDAPRNDKDLYGLRYAEFVVPLVKAVQELSKLNDAKDEQIKNLQQQIDEIKELLTTNKTTTDQKQHSKLTAALLSQNVPNPFISGTSIAYSLPEKYRHAKMVISDKNGRTIKEVLLAGKGNGTVNLNGIELNTGTYQYSLYVNNILVETKQMVVAK